MYFCSGFSLLPFSLCQAFKAIKSFLTKLETVSEDPTKLADIGLQHTALSCKALLALETDVYIVKASVK